MTVLLARERAVSKRAEVLLAAATRHEATRLLDTFASHGIYPIVLKGLAFAHSIYSDPTERPHSDIDLLVGDAQFDQALAVAQTCGYVAAVETTAAAVRGQRDLRKGGPLPVAVDLHSRLFNPALFSTVDDFDELSQRAQPLPALGRHGRALSAVDALLHATVHRVAHHYGSQSPMWLRDIDLLARALSPDEWRQLAERAAAWRVAAVVSDGLQSAHLMYGTPLGDSRSWQVAADEPSRALLRNGSNEWRVQALSVWYAEGFGAKWNIVRAHLFPDRNYMMASYSTQARWRLPELYVRRLVSGALRGAWRRVGR